MFMYLKNIRFYIFRFIYNYLYYLRWNKTDISTYRKLHEIYMTIAMTILIISRKVFIAKKIYLPWNQFILYH